MLDVCPAVQIQVSPSSREFDKCRPASNLGRMNGGGELKAVSGLVASALNSSLLGLGVPVPPGLSRPLFYNVTGLDLIAMGVVVLAIWLIDVFLLSWIRLRIARASVGEADHWRWLLLRAVRPPARLALWTSGVYLCLLPVLSGLPREHPIHVGAERVLNLVLFVALLWAVTRLIGVIHPWMQARVRVSASPWDDVLVPILFRAARVMGPLVAIVLAAPLLGLPIGYDGILRRLVTLAIIAAVAWVLIQAVLISEKAILDHLSRDQEPLRVRSISTQVNLLKRILIALITVFAVGCVLMTFDDVRRVGASILASAGLAGIVLGFAAQRILGNLFAGIQIAFTQPIRLGDAVVVEGEFGNIEEITLTHVAVRIWDLRRLVLPISYFIERPFQNWSRGAKPNLLGTVTLSVDYSCPVDQIREQARAIVERSTKWDKGAFGVQVTDATDKTMQIRILVSAADPGKAFDLRCEIREGLIRWLQSVHPGALPKFRTELQDNLRRSEEAPRPHHAATPQKDGHGIRQ